MMREINDMLSGVRVKDKVITKNIDGVKTKIIQEGGDLKQCYKSINDLRKEGYSIVTHKLKNKNIRGKNSKYAKYVL